MLLRLTLLFIVLPPSTLTIKNNIQEGTVRLSEGKTPYEGRVEIFHSGIWGTICDDKWTAKEAGVVCHMMGAMREGATVKAFSEFGNGIGSIWLDEVSCTGNESSIVDCSHTEWGISDCTHAEDVGVICVPSGETTMAPSTIATPPKFYIAPHENIVRWGHNFHLTCFTPSDDLTRLHGQIVWCRNDIMFFNQSIDSQNSTGQWVYTAQHALSIHTATYTCGLEQCQRSLATVDVTAIPENECKLVQIQNPNCEIDKINEVEAEVAFLAKGNSDDVNVEHVLRTALPKIADVASDGISNARSLDRTVDIIHKMATIADASNVTIHPKTFVTVVDHLLSTKRTTAWRNKSTQIDSSVNKILQAVSTFGNVVAKTVTLNKNVTFTTENLVMTVARKPRETIVNFPGEGDTSDTYLTLPPQLHSNSSDFSYVASKFKSISEILGGTSKNDTEEGDSEEVVSDVLSLSLNGEKQRINLQPALRMSFTHPKHVTAESDIVCAYWKTNKTKGSHWSTDGCKAFRNEENITDCRCDHLTNFAILIRPYHKETEEAEALTWISLIGCCISVFFCIITIVIFLVLWRFIKSDMNLLIINLCLTIALAYILFVVGVERTENEIVCMVIAVFLQYLFLVVFCLMLDIGIYYFVHVTLVKISFLMANRFTSKSRKKLFLIVAYGLPVIITGITLGLTYPSNYNPKNICWLSFESGALYGFLGPVAFVVFMNLIILITLVVTMYSTQLASTGTVRRKAVMGIRSISTLLPVLGITWLFGFLSVSEDTIVFQYIFSILNSLQIIDIVRRKSSKQSTITHSSQDKMSFVGNSEVGDESLTEITKKLSVKKSGRVKAQNRSLYN
ncbi:adhesion G protein-coupled receptor B1-like isoform X2 [Ostrea edulis]|uniref:adhesion G protein-coupled receptor B1-like isoform X2 n=1 Tax=Ostrea edulis TaxID=37623 RepID=UPI0024AF7312|nr:adhesion G protein-coupled receptor B1-like isoform X2 [Ostrea edulis]XP_056016625.1 adhesion G protein-coupled receptor B1-like isoform X2 [Ostrea edulis]